jgi:hypothetical protein
MYNSKVTNNKEINIHDTIIENKITIRTVIYNQIIGTITTLLVLYILLTLTVVVNIINVSKGHTRYWTNPHEVAVTSASTSRGLCFKIEYHWRLCCVLSVSCIITLPLIHRYCKLAFWFIFFRGLYVCYNFQDVQYSTTQAIQALAQTGLAIQSHKVRQRTNQPPGHYSRTHQEGKCCMSVHLHETCVFSGILML